MNWTYTQELEKTVLENIKKNGLKNIGQVFKNHHYICVDVTEILKEHRFVRGQKAIMCIGLNEGHYFWNHASMWFNIGVDSACSDYCCKHSTSDLRLGKGGGSGMAIVMRLVDLNLSILSDDFNKLKNFDFNLYKTMHNGDVLFNNFILYRRYDNPAANKNSEEDCLEHWKSEWELMEKHYKKL